jgi:hypothetical protein
MARILCKYFKTATSLRCVMSPNFYFTVIFDYGHKYVIHAPVSFKHILSFVFLQSMEIGVKSLTCSRQEFS